MTPTRTVLQFIWPWLIGLVFLTVVPLIISFMLSLTQWDGLSESDIRWVGGENYRNIFAVDTSHTITERDPWYWAVLGGKPSDPRFFLAVYNTLLFSVFAVPLGLTAALFLAVLLNQQLTGIALFRCVYYLPHLLGGVGTILVWQWLFNPQAGLVNVVLKMLYIPVVWIGGLCGLDMESWAPPLWLHSAQWCKPALLLMYLWGNGGAMLIFLAALQNVPARLVEAACLDGASRWQQFRHVTLPQISPAILFNLIVGLIASMRIFKDAYLLRHWSQDEGLLFYMLYLYEHAFEEPVRLGYASALSWLLFAVLMFLTLIIVLTSRKWVHYERLA